MRHKSNTEYWLSVASRPSFLKLKISLGPSEGIRLASKNHSQWLNGWGSLGVTTLPSPSAVCVCKSPGLEEDLESKRECRSRPNNRCNKGHYTSYWYNENSTLKTVVLHYLLNHQALNIRSTDDIEVKCKARSQNAENDKLNNKTEWSTVVWIERDNEF